MARLDNTSHTGSRAIPGVQIFLLLAIGIAALLGGCDKPPAPQPQQPEVTVITVAPQDTPVTYEFVGSTASSQQVEVRHWMGVNLDW